MRTEFGGAGRNAHGSGRPIWDLRGDADPTTSMTEADYSEHVPRSTLGVLPDVPAPRQSPPPPSGRHRGSHRAAEAHGSDGAHGSEAHGSDGARGSDGAPGSEGAPGWEGAHGWEGGRALGPDGLGPDGLGPDDRKARTGGDLIRTGVRGVGQTLITAGLIVLLFVVYELFITDLLNSQTQQNLTQELRQDWGDDPTLAGPDLPSGGLAEIPLGDGIAFIRIPAFGADYVRVVVEGTNANELSEGPGHYVGSAMPGELGNFALAGHRVSQGSPFLDLDKLMPGDAVVIETADTWFTYRVLGDPATGNFGADPSGISGLEIVSPAAVEVINPIPGSTDAGAAPTEAYLTLTTCNPKFSAQQRLIIHALLDGPGLPKADYPDGPPAMTGN